MASPNVIVRTHYYEVSSKRRDFYSSANKNDYMGYIDTGIKSNQAIDYMDYAGSEEKSSGLFSSKGLLSDEEKKRIRKKLRSTESCIWDIVISFEEDYGKRNVYDYKQAVEMLNKTLPKYLESLGIDYDNVTWFAGLHTNTKHRHIHLCFFENEPRIYDPKKKCHRYRKGKIRMEKVQGFKMSIEKHFLSPVEGIKRVRKMAVDEMRNQVTGRIVYDDPAFRRLLKELYEEIPESGDLGYESKNMDSVRPKLDELSNLAMSNTSLDAPYRFLLKKIEERDEEIREICLKQRIDDPTPYLYGPKFRRDLKRRMGNAAIKEIVAQRNREKALLGPNAHPKARIRNHTKSVLALLAKSATVSERMERDALEGFDWFERKKAEYEAEKESKETEYS